MSLDPHIFRAYDIRGKADSQITAEACLLIGRAFGSILRELYKTDHPTVAVGRDARTHGPGLQQSLVEGLVAAGCHVKDIGQTPSPVNYFAICNSKLDGGVQVTASHNPKEDNGLKLQIRDAEAFCGDDLQTLRQRIEVGTFLEGEGTIEPLDAVSAYMKHIEAMFGDDGKDLSIVIDNGNGVSGPVYNEVCKNIGCTVTELFSKPDGEFPNHPADPSKWDTLKDLQEAMKKENADIGIAFDGDGDRLGLVDETGTIRTADEILLLLSKDHLMRHAGGSIVYTVSSSGALKTEITRWGGAPVMTKVGHAFVEHTMKKCSAMLGGEQSGHFFCFENYYHYDDALVAALWVLRIVKNAGIPLSQLFDSFAKVYQLPELRPYCPDDQKTQTVSSITNHFQKTYPVETMDGARIDFGDGAWAGIRQSNTSPCLSICMEARSQEKLQHIEKEVLDHLKTYPEIKL